MKILIAAEIFPPDIGGPATYSLELADELVRLGHRIQVICYSNSQNRECHPFNLTRVIRGQNTVMRYGSYLRNLLRYGKDADVIYAQGPVGSGLPAVMAAKLLGKKLVVKVVGDYAWEQAMNFGKTNLMIDEFQKVKPKGKYFWLKKAETWVCQRAARVIVPSHYLKKIVTGWGVNEGKIEVIYNSIKSFGEISTLPTSDDIILSIGRLVPWKGFDVLIDLLTELLKVNPRFKLVILGKGPEEPRLREKVNRLNLSTKVEIRRVDFRLRNQYLKTARLFVLNTGYEGLAHTILEAMSAGLPVVTTKVGGNPEIINDNQNGLLVEYNNIEQLKNAILNIWQNQETRERFIKNSQATLKKFSFPQMIESTVKILNS